MPWSHACKLPGGGPVENSYEGWQGLRKKKWQHQQTNETKAILNRKRTTIQRESSQDICDQPHISELSDKKILRLLPNVIKETYERNICFPLLRTITLLGNRKLMGDKIPMYISEGRHLSRNSTDGLFSG